MTSSLSWTWVCSWWQLVSFPAVSQIRQKSHHLNSSCTGRSSSPAAGKIPEFFCSCTVVTASQRRSVELGFIAWSSDSWNFFLLLILSLREVLSQLDKFPSYKLLRTDHVSQLSDCGRFSVQKGLPRWLSWKNTCLPMQETSETQVRSLGQEDPLEESMVTHFIIPTWRIPWTEKPGRLWFMGSQRFRHDWSKLGCMCLSVGRRLPQTTTKDHTSSLF